MPLQPVAPDQPENVQFMWFYGLHANNCGTCVKKPMTQCSGEEIICILILSALVGAEQPWTSLWGIGEFASAVLATRLTLSSSGGHTVPSAEGFDGADRDAQGF